MLIRHSSAAFSSRLDALKWTPYLAECLQVLQENKETASDVLLALIVRLQVLTEEVNQAAGVDGGKMPWPFYFKGFKNQFQDIRASIPEGLLNNRKCHNWSCIRSDLPVQPSSLLPCNTRRSASTNSLSAT